MTLTELRLKLLLRGYDPIPLSGKRPPMQAWSKVVPDEQIIRLWAGKDGYPSAINTGILAQRTPCLDLDVLNPECADAMEDYIRAKYEGRGVVLARVGRWPKRAFPFRTDAPFPKITLNLGRGEEKIEFLASGQQFAAFGTHPDTHKDYQWPRGSILDVAHEDLPPITQAEARADVVKLGEIARSYSYPVPEPSSKMDGDGAWDQADAPRLDRDRATADIIKGENLHDSTVALAASDVALGFSRENSLRHLRELMHQCMGRIDIERWKDRYADLPRTVDSAWSKFHGPEKPAPERPQWLPRFLDIDPVPQPEWALRDIIPIRTTALFSGEGGTGKSCSALHLCAAFSLDQTWLHYFPNGGPSFYIDAEDPPEILHWRLDKIREHYQTSFDEIYLGGLHIRSMFGRDSLLATVDKSGVVQPTAFYRQLLEEAGDIKPKLIVIASSADVFAGNESDRTQVRQFVSMLNHMAIIANGAVLLISHPSLTGIASGSGLSGSTAWHNSVRSRMVLSGPKKNGGGEEDVDSDLRELQFHKNQYGKPSHSLTLRWKDGLLLPESSGDPLVKLAREAKADEVFITLVDRFNRAGRPVTDTQTAPNYAPRVFVGEQEATSLKITKSELEKAMTRLFAGSRIRMDEWGPPSKRRRFIVLP